ncbi:MAG: PLP-dependent aminotransferase family protein [Pseudomonadales bacterium]
MFDFAVGQTNPETFPVEAFKRAATAAIDAESAAMNQYPGGKGHLGLRTLMARRESEREGVAVDPEKIALMNGSMQAVTLAGQALMDQPGDSVITEAFTYSGTIAAYRGIGLKMTGIPIDEQGMRVDVLADTLDAMPIKPKFIYTLTSYQNPTGTTMSLARRSALIELAEYHQLPVVEDNCYGDVHFEGEKQPSLYALKPDPRHIYIGSLSKIFAPGVRLGYLMADSPYFQKIVSRRFDAGSNYFAASVLAEFYKEDLWGHCERANKALRVKRDLLLEALDASLSDICAWSHPVGGLFLWLRLPEDVDLDLLKRVTAEAGFFYAEGKDFNVTGEAVHYLRLAFGHVPDALITQGIPILAESIQRCRSSNAAREFEHLFDD